MGLRANQSVLVAHVLICFVLFPLFVLFRLICVLSALHLLQRMNSPVDRIHQIVGTVVGTLCGAQVIGGNDFDVEVTALRAVVA